LSDDTGLPVLWLQKGGYYSVSFGGIIRAFPESEFLAAFSAALALIGQLPADRCTAGTPIGL
jgi:hypothetical protein